MASRPRVRGQEARADALEQCSARTWSRKVGQSYSTAASERRRRDSNSGRSVARAKHFATPADASKRAPLDLVTVEGTNTHTDQENYVVKMGDKSRNRYMEGSGSR